MRLRKYVLVLDFDDTVTFKDHISKSWGDRLAGKLRHIQKTYPIEIYLLSMANISHIIHTLLLSGSVDLLVFFLNVSMIANELTDIQKINYNWGEKMKSRKEMIKKVTHTQDFHNIKHIIAYKKVNYMINHSKLENVPHSHVFFLDDNPDNIHFASYYGFNAFKVDNSKPKTTIFDRLDQIDKQLQKNFLYYK